MNKQYCTICGKLLVNAQPIQWGHITVKFYVSSSSEPVCFGDCEPLPERVEVPKAFYDAFREEEGSGD